MSTSTYILPINERPRPGPTEPRRRGPPRRHQNRLSMSHRRNPSLPIHRTHSLTQRIGTATTKTPKAENEGRAPCAMTSRRPERNSASQSPKPRLYTRSHGLRGRMLQGPANAHHYLTLMSTQTGHKLMRAISRQQGMGLSHSGLIHLTSQFLRFPSASRETSVTSLRKVWRSSMAS